MYCRCKLTKIYFKELLDMTGTETFTVLSTEDLEQTSGGLAVWEDGYGRWLYYREFGLMLTALQLIRVQYVLE